MPKNKCTHEWFDERCLKCGQKDWMSESKEKKVWTLYKGKSTEALNEKESEWINMMQVVLAGSERQIIIEIREI